MICLDTNAVIALLNNEASPVRARLRAALTEGQPVAISSIVLFELWFGVVNSARPERNADRLAEFLASTIHVLEFDAEDAREAGDIRGSLKRAGVPIGPYDVLIAAHARRRGALLVTANQREFARVPGLRFADWATPA